MYKESIGIVGGFGAYATLNFYKSILEAFSTECERDLPHIYMDNDFTMPSRTRSLLYGDERSTIVEMISDSIKKLSEIGADYIVMPCGTAHAFLPDIFKLHPEYHEKVLNIIENLRDSLIASEVSKVLVIAAEGTLKNRIYQEYLTGTGIECVSPSEKDYPSIRYFMESVKQNKMNNEVYRNFIDFINTFSCSNIILGCTEFPVLTDELSHSDYGNTLKKYTFWDPLIETISKLKIILK